MPDKARKTHKPEDHLPTYQVVTSVVTGLHILDSLSWDLFPGLQLAFHDQLFDEVSEDLKSFSCECQKDKVNL